MFANGCGGKGSKAVNSVLMALPSSKLFYGPCVAHDVVYSLVSREPIKVIDGDKVYFLNSRKDCDIFWYDLMKEMTNSCGWFSRKIMLWSANRNYRWVRKFGEDFFTHTH